MKNKSYFIIIDILIVIALVMLGVLIVVFSKSKQVDCDSYTSGGTSYKPMPKQCKKGE